MVIHWTFISTSSKSCAEYTIQKILCFRINPSKFCRSKTVHIIHSSLERGDRIYRQLQTNKLMLELLIQKLNEHRGADIDENLNSVHGSSQVSKTIQVLAQKYCVKSHASFEELSKIAQKIKACRSDLMAYDRSQKQDQPSPSSSQYPDVKEIYKKVWLAEGGERDAMRMRGLLGNATEEFVESLSNKSQEEVDTEQLYRMANVLADCNGLKVMLDRIGSLKSISRNRELIQVLLKLFLICVKVRRCQEVLRQPELDAISTLLKVLQMCLQAENDSLQSSITEQLLEIMETILSKAASDTLYSFPQFSLTFGGLEYVTALISCTNCPNVRNSQSVLRHLIGVLNALVYGNEVKMAPLCEHFKDAFNFERFDTERTAEAEFKLKLFCVVTNRSNTIALVEH